MATTKKEKKKTEEMNIIKEMNIYERLWAITHEMPTVAKNLSVSTGKGSYKAVSEADVLRAVESLEEQYRVYSYPLQRKILESKVLTKENEYKGTVTKANSFYMRLYTIYRFVNIDNPNEYIDIPAYGDGIDTGDKATGKAMTYCDKYALMKAYKIQTGEDQDQEASKEYSEVVDGVTKVQTDYIKKLYNEEEIKQMLERLEVEELASITKDQASKMIMARSTAQ